MILLNKSIIGFGAATAKQDVPALPQILDTNFRVVMNRLFGAKQAVVLDRKAYLEKIKNKEFGGMERTIDIQHLSVSGSTAVATVVFSHTELSFKSFLQLVESDSGEWKIVSDVPTVL